MDYCKYVIKIFVCLFFCSAQPSLHSQNTELPASPEDIWLAIEEQIDKQGRDTSRYFLLQPVREKCGDDYACLYQNYHFIQYKLERLFNIPAAIYVAEEIVKIARRANAQEDEAQAHIDLFRFFHAIGDSRMYITSLDRARRILEKTGDQSKLTYVKVSLLKSSLVYRDVEEILPQMDTLLAQAESRGDQYGIKLMLFNLIEIRGNSGHYEGLEKNIEALEKIGDSLTGAEKFRIGIRTTMGRAKLAVGQNDLNGAVSQYQKTLEILKKRNDKWVQVYVLQQLADLEWKRGNHTAANHYLEQAEHEASDLNLFEMLALNFEIKSRFAEEEGRPAEALDFLKKKLAYQQKWESRSAGFDMRTFYLQRDKEQLTAEKENQQLALKLKKVQLRNSIFIISLVFLLAAGLFIGLYKQRKGKKELAKQYSIVQDQAEQLKSLDAAKSRFFANVSHELRTPLTLMLGPVKTLLKESQLTGKQVKLLQMAAQSGKQLNQLVNEILDLQKLQMDKMELNESPVELSSFFSQYMVQFESLAYRKQIRYSSKILIDNGLVANVDREKCRQILYNLLSNAFKFTPAGGEIKVEMEILSSGNDGTAAQFLIAVSDSGSGIHPDDLPHVFDRYFQASRPDKPVEGGTGIGLALCQQYVELFGGKIEVESELGKGTSFRVVFPIVLTDNVPAATPSLQPTVEKTDVQPMATSSEGTESKTAGPKPTILVVEDNPDLQDYIRLILSEKYQVVTADNGQVALEKLSANPEGRQEQPIADLILSDLMMPVMDGFQLLEKLKSSDGLRHIPVIMLTARAEVSDKLKALRIGVDDYLTKPFEEEELLVRIENLLKNQAVRQVEISKEKVAGSSMPVVSKEDQEWLENFEAYIQKNISSDMLSIPTLASDFAMSESTLLRQLKRLTGLSPVKYLQEMRLNKARQLLANRTYGSIAKVAAEVGYSDTRSFSRSFKGRFGKLPSDFISG